MSANAHLLLCDEPHVLYDYKNCEIVRTAKSMIPLLWFGLFQKSCLTDKYFESGETCLIAAKADAIENLKGFAAGLMSSGKLNPPHTSSWPVEQHMQILIEEIEQDRRAFVQLACGEIFDSDDEMNEALSKALDDADIVRQGQFTSLEDFDRVASLFSYGSIDLQGRSDRLSSFDRGPHVAFDSVEFKKNSAVIVDMPVTTQRSRNKRLMWITGSGIGWCAELIGYTL